MLRKQFFRKYGRIIHYEHLAAAINENFKDGVISKKVGEQTLRHYKNESSREFSFSLANEFGKVLQSEGVVECGMFTAKELSRNKILKTKPFVEFALLPNGLWNKINSEYTLSASEIKKRKDLNKLCQHVYNNPGTVDNHEKAFGRALSEMAIELKLKR